MLLGDDNSSASKAGVDYGSRAKSTEPGAGLFDSPENAVASTTPAPPSTDGWHDIDDFTETIRAYGALNKELRRLIPCAFMFPLAVP